MTRFLIKLGAVLLFLASTTSFGDDDYRSKIGFDIKALRTHTDSDVGWLLGVRNERFIGKSNFHWGLAGFFGTPRGTDPIQDMMYYGGLVLGYDGMIKRNIRYEFTILGGYGQGKLNIVNNVGANNVIEKSYFVVEPSASIGFQLGRGWRIMLAGSYIYQNQADDFNAFSMGFRLDYKTQTRIKEIDD